MRSMGHPDYRYTPWTDERRAAASERAKATLAGKAPAMNEHWSGAERVIPGWAGRRRRKRVEWTPADRKQLAELWAVRPLISGTEIAELLGRDPGSIYAKAHQMGLPPRRGRRPDVRERNLARGRAPKRKSDQSGLRRFHGVANSDGPKIVLEPHDPRYRAGTTVFPTTVIPAAKLPRLLKSGHNSRKIGKEVAKGWLRGAPIFTLTLEERATCPRTCPVFASCYGNNMPFAHRIHDDGTLTRRLWGELASLNAEHPNGFLVRLHVLGDLYSPEYVDFWRQALDDFPALNIFGFTARQPGDPIGRAVIELVRDRYERFRIRFSGLAMEEDGAVVVDRKEEAIGVICPAELDPDRCCATCALCWNSNKTISFLRH
jgi:hypothetical protein